MKAGGKARASIFILAGWRTMCISRSEGPIPGSVMDVDSTPSIPRHSPFDSRLLFTNVAAPSLTNFRELHCTGLSEPH